MQSVTSNAVFNVINNLWIQKDSTVIKAEFCIEQMATGIYSIRWYWAENGYYFLRMNGTTSQIQFGYKLDSYEYIYRTL
jgi:hypothetical protein